MPSPKNYVVTVKAGVTGLSLPGVGSRKSAGAVVELTPHQFLQMSAVQLSKVTVSQTPSTGGLTAPQIDAVFATDADVALKQDASTAATDAELVAGLAVKAPLVALWAAGATYKAGQLVVNAGQVYTAKADFTSGVTFDVANWNYAAPGLLDFSEITADVAFTTNASWQTISGLTVTPASVNRDVILEVNGMAVSHSASQGSASFHIGIYDVTAGAAKAARTIDIVTSNKWAAVPSVRYRIPAGSTSHTYMTAVFASTTGTFTARTSGGMGWLFTAMQV